MPSSRLLFCLFCCSLVLFLSDSVSAEPSAVDLRAKVSRHLDHEGYLGRFRNGQDFSRGVSAYLWDHRHELKTVDFSRRQELDALLCLLVHKGYPGYEELASEEQFVRRCRNITK